jgi:GT2 family glycosyltransferase
MPAVSVIVPCRTRGPWLDECLAALERQTYRDFDVYVVAEEPLTLAGANVHALTVGPVLPNRKRETAARASTAPIVAFLDDDAAPAPEWLESAMRHFADPAVAGAGGPGVTPADDGPRERAGGAVFASHLVTAGARHRYVAERGRDVDMLPTCNLLMRREIFLRDAEASARFWPGEDLVACRLARSGGGRIVYDPAALVYHHRRALFAGHLRQVASYARFRGADVRRNGLAPGEATFAVPAAFVLAHVPVAAALASRRTRRLAVAAIGLYAAAVAVSAAREARAVHANPGLVALGIYLTHLAYGGAFIAGWLRGNLAPDR